MWRGVVTRAEKGSALGAEHDERVDPGRVAVLSGAVQVQLAYTVHLSDWFVQGIRQGIWNSGRGSGYFSVTGLLHAPEQNGAQVAHLLDLSVAHLCACHERVVDMACVPQTSVERCAPSDALRSGSRSTRRRTSDSGGG